MRLDIYKEYKFRTKNRNPLNDFTEGIKVRVESDRKRIEEFGYHLLDLRDVNIFYDEENDQLTYIDLSNIRKV